MPAKTKKSRTKPKRDHQDSGQPGSAPERRPHDRWVQVHGARVHNLKNIDVNFPQGKLVVCCGVSGSGKSSFAFDTVFAEGQRRYIESLSAYARQFLGNASKPDVDRIDGLSPAVSIDQKTTSHNPRSTVGTVTEIWDYLRVLFARGGTPHCPQCSSVLEASTPANLVDKVTTNYANKQILLLAPVVRGRKGTHANLFEECQAKGFARVAVNGVAYRIEDVPELDRKLKHTIDIVIDRLTAKKESGPRLLASIETALTERSDVVSVALLGSDSKLEERTDYSTQTTCLACAIDCPPLEPRLFSFNSPYGACPSCAGLGGKRAVDRDLLVDAELSVAAGALLPWYTSSGWEHFLSITEQALASVGQSSKTPWNELPAQAQKLVLEGSSKVSVTTAYGAGVSRRHYTTTFEGLVPWVTRRGGTSAEQGDSRLERYFSLTDCVDCAGSRLGKLPAAVQFQKRTLPELASMSLSELQAWTDQLALEGNQARIAGPLIKEVSARLGFLVHVGLGYLSLNRTASTLSGGENQRIRLASQIGSGLTGVLYVLDEPSIGLHPKDNAALLCMLHKLRDLGNTVLVVEHDEETLNSADWVIEIGPEAGSNGGQVVYCGTPDKWQDADESVTFPYISGDRTIATPDKRRRSAHTLALLEPTGNNLQLERVDFPLGCLIAVTGVSGSGKSTLISDTLAPALSRALHKTVSKTSPYRGIEGAELVDKVVVVDQSPIGRTPRSNPATYTGVFDRIRALYASLPKAKMHGYGPGRFSFNVRGGRCEACTGEGQLRVEMSFLPDVYVQCQECHGSRYNSATLDVKYKGKSIADVLGLTIDQACEFFSNVPAIRRQLGVLREVGLGYVTVGHPAPLLSGGEAQRVKLATELQRRSTGKTFYVLDEPTTGLHFSDIEKLMNACQKLVDQGNTMVIVEHNLDVIRCADHVIDLGPEGGTGGGKLVASGTPEEVAANTGHTAAYLARELARHGKK